MCGFKNQLKFSILVSQRGAAFLLCLLTNLNFKLPPYAGSMKDAFCFSVLDIYHEEKARLLEACVQKTRGSGYKHGHWVFIFFPSHESRMLHPWVYSKCDCRLFCAILLLDPL